MCAFNSKFLSSHCIEALILNLWSFNGSAINFFMIFFFIFIMKILEWKHTGTTWNDRIYDKVDLLIETVAYFNWMPIELIVFYSAMN